MENFYKKVVLIGTSAGGSGVFQNCDMMADKIQAVSCVINVRKMIAKVCYLQGYHHLT